MYRIITLFLLLNLLILGCKPSAKTYDKNPINFKIDKLYNQKEVSAFVSKALLRLGWKVDEIKDGSISASLNHRSWLAKTTVKFNNLNEIVILSNSLYKSEKPSDTMSGKPIVEYHKKVPYNWLMNIKKFVLEEVKMNLEIQSLNSNPK